MDHSLVTYHRGATRVAPPSAGTGLEGRGSIHDAFVAVEWAGRANVRGQCVERFYQARRKLSINVE
jgi:hypothetical protein